VIGRLGVVLAIGAFAAACQTQPPVTELPSGPPTPTFATVTFHVPPPTPRAAASFEAAKYLQMRPDAVHVWSDSARFASLDVTVKDGARATALLGTAARLQPAALRYCPADFGLQYTIEWWQDGRIVAVGSLHAQGCQDLQLDGGPPLATTLDFWNALADLVGKPEPLLHPTLP
jgi:hypothetical protein